ncbi:MAG: NAD(P)H-dependent glycerol-3-phosphate dehydrogenase [Candidatus Poseidoniaceae archaeon]|nr:NAD(P)H-dependent glycerol-3-phosphate dehydrogenase [Candidatus Poseidoniaceae archaeon]
MARIGILGLGNWGTALAKVWLEDGHQVTGWTIEQEVHHSITMDQVNKKYLKGVELKGLTSTMQLGDVMAECELVVLALPSSVILSVVEDVIPHLRPSHVLLDLAKGLAEGNRSISEVIVEKLTAAGMGNAVAVMTGPTIAPEVASGVLTLAQVASHDSSVADRLTSTLSTPTLILVPASDPIGAELWGAFKNVVALACGLVDGLKIEGSLGGDNLKAAIFAAGFREGCILLPELGAKGESAFGPAGMGDLFVTATSPVGRNRRMGEKLGRGLSLAQALDEMVMVAEGVRAARMFGERARMGELPAPFIRSLNILLDGDITAEDCVRRLVELR